MGQAQAIAEARKYPKQARSRALVEAILDATARILVEDGFAQTTTNRVAERAGVSIGSLYQYFPSREALVAAVARRHSERLKTALEAELSDDRLTLDQAITSMLAAIDRAHQVWPELTAVLAGEVPKLGSLDWKAENTLRGVALARRLLERHAREIRPGLDLDAAAFACSASVEGAMNSAAHLRSDMIVSGAITYEIRTMLLSYLSSSRPD